MITLEHVYIEYTKTRIALRDINIHVDKGEFVFIVGPSGAGKSTFIKMLTHELVPYKPRAVLPAEAGHRVPGLPSAAGKDGV